MTPEVSQTDKQTEHSVFSIIDAMAFIESLRHSNCK